MGRLVDLEAGDFVGRLALQREQARAGRRDGWSGSSSTGTGSSPPSRARALPPAISASIDRSAVPVRAARRSPDREGHEPRLSPILKQAIGLASVPPAYEVPGTRLAVEWIVEGHRGRVDAIVVPLPFPDLPRKRGLTS